MKYALAILALLSLSPLHARSWTSSDGKKVEATYVRSEQGKVTLKRIKDGKTFILPLSMLIQADKDYITEKAKQAAASSNDADTGKQGGGDAAKPEVKVDSAFIDNFEKEWPGLISLKKDFEITEVEADVDNPEKFIYHSRHFEFIADARLSNSVIKRFAEIFEATLQYMQELPISSQKAMKHTAKEKKKILLFSQDSKYFSAGGPQGSAGVYMRRGSSEQILVKMTSLGLKKMGSGFTLDRDKPNKTLPHEITHMFTDPCYYSPGARGWFSEGLAEYLAVTPYRGGKYTVRGNMGDLKEYVTGFGKDGTGGRALLVNKNSGKKKEHVQVGSLKKFFLMSYSEFTANGNHNYGVGALITYYFFHLEDKGARTNITNFMKALQEGKQGQEALDVLLAGRSYEELEEKIQKAWRTRGVKMIFSK